MSGALQLLKTCSPRRTLANCTKISAKPTCHRTAIASYSQAPEMYTPSHKTMRFERRSNIIDAEIAQLTDHMNKTFAPLHFPEELAVRLLTHASHPVSNYQGHNGRLSFSGRRVLQSYFLLFLHSCPDIQPTDDYDKIAHRAIETYLLGEFVAPHWSIGKVVRWKSAGLGPQIPLAQYSVGLYKILGTTVEAIVGGIYHQFGAAVAHRIFHTRVLPHLLLKGSKGGVQENLHDHALEICKRMGGKT